MSIPNKYNKNKRQLTKEMEADCIIKDVAGLPFRIVCTNTYEFEGRKFLTGELRLHSWGRPIPKNWRKATSQDIRNYYINF